LPYSADRILTLFASEVSRTLDKTEEYLVSPVLFWVYSASQELGVLCTLFRNFLTVCVLFRMQEETGKLSLKLGSLSKESYMVQNCIQHIGPSQTIVGLPRSLQGN